MNKTITVHIPMRFAIRGGRKTIISEIEHPKTQLRIENAPLKALARAHRWRRQIETGEYASITELAEAQRVNESYACRLLRLTLLAPELVVEILNGVRDDALSMSRLLKPFPAEWAAQLSIFRPSHLANK
ncbi:MAG TPA: hypothetical protein VFB29_02195 [Pseudolabrys sp.]|nr:hypothetical protein [Pseudolabrys sp.]